MNDQSLEKLGEVSSILSTKESFYLTFNSNKTDFNYKFNTPLKLKSNRNYELALQYFSTSNYLVNITQYNNRFIYSIDNGANWITLLLDPGAYEYTNINSEIRRQMIEKKHADTKGEPFITIGAVLQTFKIYINISNPTYKVDFTQPKTFRSLLGFNSKILNSGYNISDSTAQITTVSSIQIHCDLIAGSFHNGKQSNILYSFPSYLVPSGYKMNVIPANMFYLPINRNIIDSISFRVTDDEENTLDFRGEEMSVAVHLRQI